MAKKPQPVQVLLRIPKPLRERLHREAERHGQTFNAEILSRLTGSFEVSSLLEETRKTVEHAAETLRATKQRMDESEGLFASYLAEKYNVARDQVLADIEGFVETQKAEGLPAIQRKTAEQSVKITDFVTSLSRRLNLPKAAIDSAIRDLISERRSESIAQRKAEDFQYKELQPKDGDDT